MSVTFGDRRHHGSKIELRNHCRSPVTGSARRSSTRDARTSIAPPSWSPAAAGHARYAPPAAAPAECRERHRTAEEELGHSV
jgi:hypothetical protein